MGQTAAASTGAYVRHYSQPWGSGAQFPARIQGVSVPGEWNPAFVWLPQSLLRWDVPCNRNPHTLIIQKPRRGRGRRLVGAKGSGKNWIGKNFLLAKSAACPKVTEIQQPLRMGESVLEKQSDYYNTARTSKIAQFLNAKLCTEDFLSVLKGHFYIGF